MSVEQEVDPLYSTPIPSHPIPVRTHSVWQGNLEDLSTTSNRFGSDGIELNRTLPMHFNEQNSDFGEIWVLKARFMVSINLHTLTGLFVSG